LWCRDGLADGGHLRSYGAAQGHGYYHGHGGRRAVRRLETARDRGRSPLALLAGVMLVIGGVMAKRVF
jgi:hypothetical protein